MEGGTLGAGLESANSENDLVEDVGGLGGGCAGLFGPTGGFRGFLRRFRLPLVLDR